jgi:hypothetical protein
MPILKACSRCATPFDPKQSKWPHRFCPGCELTRADRSPSTRAQDGEYRRNRQTVLAGDPPCALCGQPGADTVDHITPVSRGGTNELANLQPAHRSCNRAKGGQVAHGTHAPRGPQPPSGTRLR